MLDNIEHTRTNKSHMHLVFHHQRMDTQLDPDQTHIMPRHSRRFQDRDSAPSIVLNILEVHYTSIIVILSNEQRLLETSRVYVSKRMVVGVPATETEIDTADSSEVVVHDHDLFVVRPKLNGICGRYSTKRTSEWACSNESTLATDMIGMPHNYNIRVKRF